MLPLRNEMDGFGFTPHEPTAVEGDDPMKMHQLMAATLDQSVSQLSIDNQQGAGKAMARLSTAGGHVGLADFPMEVIVEEAIR